MRHLFLLFFLLSPIAYSEEMSFAFSGVATGSLNGIAFSGAVEILGKFNADKITQSSNGVPGVLGVLDDSAVAVLPDGTAVSFSDSTYIFNSPDPTNVGTPDAFLMGFGVGPWPSYSSNEAGDLLAIRGFASYNLSQPFVADTSLPSWGYIEQFDVPAHPVLTSCGLLTMDDETESLTFSQLIVPEPSAWILFLIGLLVVNYRSRPFRRGRKCGILRLATPDCLCDLVHRRSSGRRKGL